MALNAELIAIQAQHNVYVQRLAAGLGNDAKPFVESIGERISTRINREVGKNLTPLRREKLLADIGEIVNEELKAYTSDLRVGHSELGAYEAGFQAKTVNTLYPTVEAATIGKSVVNQTARNTLIKVGEGSYTSYNQMLSKFTRDNAEQIQNIVAQGFISGTSTREIAATVMNEVDSRLVKTQRQAKSIAITGSNHYANSARKAFFENEDVVIGWRFVATLDSKTSQICRGLDGKLFKKGEPGYERAQPPLHPNCRSAAVPEVDARYLSEDEGGKRPENFRDAESGYLMPGQTSSKKIYYEAFKSLDAKSQDLVLGPTLGKAYRKGIKDGTLTPESFAKMTVDQTTFEPLTITEMAKKDNHLGRLIRSNL